MLSHSAIWDAIDALARRHGFTASGLARIAGLDATAFNRSKRISKDGRERWPSTESIAKVLEATGESFDHFLSRGGAYMQLAETGRTVPLLGLAQAGSGGYFDAAGFPAGQGWDEIRLPSANDEGTYADHDDVVGVRLDDGRYATVTQFENPGFRRGDRVVVRTRDGEMLIKLLHRQTARSIELHSLNPAHAPRIIPLGEVEAIGRIIWASQ